MSSVVAKRLVSPVQLGISISTLYTATNVRATLDKVTGTNTTGGAVTATLHIVPAAGSASATNMIIQARSIGAGSTEAFPEMVGHVLEPGETLQALASAAASIGVRVSGREVSQ